MKNSDNGKPEFQTQVTDLFHSLALRGHSRPQKIISGFHVLFSDYF